MNAASKLVSLAIRRFTRRFLWYECPHCGENRPPGEWEHMGLHVDPMYRCPECEKAASYWNIG